MSRPSQSLALAAALVMLPAAIAAQTVTVRVVNADTREPVVGALSYLLDRSGDVAHRTLTDDEGRAIFSGLTFGEYAVRAEMIGLATGQTPTFVLNRAGVEQELSLRPRAISIEGIEVAASERCRVRPGEGLLISQLWDEARKALAAAAYADERDLYRYETMVYQRDLDAEARVVERQIESRRQADVRTPFVSLPAEELANDGFMQTVDGVDHYYAPDAAALLSDVFLDSHCLRVREPSRTTEEAGVVGVGFEPVERRRTVDIAGTLWLDAQSAELRWLEYRYTDLPENRQNDRVGGRVEFQRMPEGTWIIPEWWIRMPNVSLWRDPDYRMVEYVSGFRESGGMVLDVHERGGAARIEVATGGIQGTVIDSVGYLLEGALIHIAGSERRAVSDLDGRFDFDDLPEGTYTLRFGDPRLELFGFEPTTVPVEVRRGEWTSVKAFMPSVTSILSDRCWALLGTLPDPQGREDRFGSGVVIGWVREAESGRGVPGALVRIMWPSHISVRGIPAGGRPEGGLGGGGRGARTIGRSPEGQVARSGGWYVSIDERRTGYEVEADASGFYHVCGVPEGALVTVEVSAGEDEQKADFRIPQIGGVVEHSVEVTRR